MYRGLPTLALAALLRASVAHGHAGDPQARLWDGAMQGDTVIMAAALRSGAVIDSLDTRQNPNGRRALNWAAWYNRVPAIQFLLAHGAPLEALLKAGAEPGAANNAGRLPVETAQERGQVKVVMILATVPSPKAAPQ